MFKKIFMFSFPEGLCKDIVKREACCEKIYFCNVYKNICVGYVVCKNTIMTKFLILYVYKHKTSRL